MVVRTSVGPSVKIWDLKGQDKQNQGSFWFQFKRTLDKSLSVCEPHEQIGTTHCALPRAPELTAASLLPQDLTSA